MKKQFKTRKYDNNVHSVELKKGISMYFRVRKRCSCWKTVWIDSYTHSVLCQQSTNERSVCNYRDYFWITQEMSHHLYCEIHANGYVCVLHIMSRDMAVCEINRGGECVVMPLSWRRRENSALYSHRYIQQMMIQKLKSCLIEIRGGKITQLKK